MTAWLIESKKKTALYFFGRCRGDDRWAFTYVPSNAFRFPSKQEAEMAIVTAGLEPDRYEITEHEWPDE